MLRKIALLTFCMVSVAPTPARAVTTLEEQYKLYKVQDTIGSLGESLFGEQVSYYNGQTEFVQTDVAVKGNFDLPVSIGRRLNPNDVADTQYRHGYFKNWELEIPRVHTVFAHGDYTESTNWWHVGDRGAASVNRCSEFSPPQYAETSDSFNSRVLFSVEEFWHGYSLYVPGVGDQQILDNFRGLKPADGYSYPVMTKNFWVARCVPIANPGGNVQGEGFLFKSPDGTEYKLNHLVFRAYEPLSRMGSMQEVLVETNAVIVPNIPICCTQGVSRKEGWLLPTEVKDRFGNWVTYTYNPANPWQLTEILAKDGRKLTLTYLAGTNQIQTVTQVDVPTQDSRVWTYTYPGSSPGVNELADVLLPDGSSWHFELGAWDHMGIQYEPEDGYNFDCDQPSPLPYSSPRIGRMTHPSGAKAEFKFEPRRVGITEAPHLCIRTMVSGGAQVGIRFRNPRLLDSSALVSKVISGPGLSAPLQWLIDYEQGVGCWKNTPQVPGYQQVNVCPANVVRSRTTTLTNPDGTRSVYTFGNEYWKTEGDILKVEEQNSAGSALRTTASTYYEPNGTQLFPDPVGESILTLGDQRNATSLRLNSETRITQQQIDFITQNLAFDAFGHTTTEVKSSTLTGQTPASLTYLHTYENRTANWVLGLQTSTKDQLTNSFITETSYHELSHLPTLMKSFGLPLQTMTYRADDGTLETVTDANNRTTRLNNWRRGMATEIIQPDTKIIGSEVNDYGWITSVTDQLGNPTAYAYDDMGRLAQITHPNEVNGTDPPSWNKSTMSFAPGNAEYGLDAGHWVRTSSIGPDGSTANTARTTTHYDAFWRPVVIVTEEVNVAATKSIVVKRYDQQGRENFVSYPMLSLVDFNDSKLKGTHTFYDALDRAYRTEADAEAEVGPVVSTTWYQNGFTTLSTNPRGAQTTTSYRAYGTPSYDEPVTIQAPEGVTTTITRDVFGKTLSVTRSGPSG